MLVHLLLIVQRLRLLARRLLRIHYLGDLFVDPIVLGTVGAATVVVVLIAVHLVQLLIKCRVRLPILTAVQHEPVAVMILTRR